MDQPMVVVEKVTKRYGTFKAVSDVSFSVPAGQIVGFLGPNGAGKTTTMKIITGFMPPTDGTVSIDGFDVFDDSMELKQRIGYLPEHPPLYMDMIVSDFLVFAAELRNVPSAQIKNAVDNAIELAGLQQVSDRIVGNCSKGYRQRVGIAQALVHSPKVLILDEPTVGLDPVQIVEIRELIKSLAGERTVILSTHILPEVSATCERIIMITAGKIVGDGTEEDLWKKIAGAERFHLAAKGNPEDVRKALLQLESVDSLADGAMEGDICRLEILAKEGADPREEISLALAKQNLPVYELKPPGLTLEEVFVRLTTGEEGTKSK
jgi:ABC-2 type transport system ATP-binding protein